MTPIFTTSTNKHKRDREERKDTARLRNKISDATRELRKERDELEAAWAVCDPLVSAIDSGYLPMTTYSYGSRGPKEADELRTRAGHLPSHLVEKDSVPLLNAEYDTLPGEEDGMTESLASKLSNAVYVSEPVVKKNKPVNEGYSLSPRGYRSGDASPQQRSPRHSQTKSRPSTQWI